MDFADGTNGPIARNPLINTVLYLNKTIESFGTGFGRVFNLCDKNKIQTRYGNNDFGFVFEFMRKPFVSEVTMSDASKDFVDNESLVLDAIKNNTEANITELAKITGKSPSTVQRTITKLIQDGLAERIGSKRDGCWRLTK